MLHPRRFFANRRICNAAANHLINICKATARQLKLMAGRSGADVEYIFSKGAVGSPICGLMLR